MNNELTTATRVCLSCTSTARMSSAIPIKSLHGTGCLSAGCINILQNQKCSMLLFPWSLMKGRTAAKLEPAISSGATGPDTWRLTYDACLSTHTGDSKDSGSGQGSSLVLWRLDGIAPHHVPMNRQSNDCSQNLEHNGPGPSDSAQEDTMA